MPPYPLPPPSSASCNFDITRQTYTPPSPSPFPSALSKTFLSSPITTTYPPHQQIYQPSVPQSLLFPPPPSRRKLGKEHTPLIKHHASNDQHRQRDDDCPHAAFGGTVFCGEVGGEVGDWDWGFGRWRSWSWWSWHFSVERWLVWLGGIF